MGDQESLVVETSVQQARDQDFAHPVTHSAKTFGARYDNSFPASN
jgi:hypothetical protein